jgi:hypothetical protein
MKCKGFGRNQSWPILRSDSSICLEGLRKTTKTLSQDSPSQGRDLRPGPHEYETWGLTTQSRRLVCCWCVSDEVVTFLLLYGIYGGSTCRCGNIKKKTRVTGFKPKFTFTFTAYIRSPSVCEPWYNEIFTSLYTTIRQSLSSNKTIWRHSHVVVNFRSPKIVFNIVYIFFQNSVSSMNRVIASVKTRFFTNKQKM